VVSAQLHRANTDGEEPTPDSSENDQTVLVSRVPEHDRADSGHYEREPTEPTDHVDEHEGMPTVGHVHREYRENDSDNTRRGGDAGGLERVCLTASLNM
jgi:hypothetical protein